MDQKNIMFSLFFLGNKTTIIIIVVVVVIVILVVTILAVYCCCCKNGKDCRQRWRKVPDQDIEVKKMDL